MGYTHPRLMTGIHIIGMLAPTIGLMNISYLLGNNGSLDPCTTDEHDLYLSEAFFQHRNGSYNKKIPTREKKTHFPELFCENFGGYKPEYKLLGCPW